MKWRHRRIITLTADEGLILWLTTERERGRRTRTSLRHKTKKKTNRQNQTASCLIYSKSTAACRRHLYLKSAAKKPWFIHYRGFKEQRPKMKKKNVWMSGVFIDSHPSADNSSRSSIQSLNVLQNTSSSSENRGQKRCHTTKHSRETRMKGRDLTITEELNGMNGRRKDNQEATKSPTSPRRRAHFSPCHTSTSQQGQSSVSQKSSGLRPCSHGNDTTTDPCDCLDKFETLGRRTAA